MFHFLKLILVALAGERKDCILWELVSGNNILIGHVELTEIEYRVDFTQTTKVLYKIQWIRMGLFVEIVKYGLFMGCYGRLDAELTFWLRWNLLPRVTLRKVLVNISQLIADNLCLLKWTINHEETFNPLLLSCKLNGLQECFYVFPSETDEVKEDWLSYHKLVEIVTLIYFFGVGDLENDDSSVW